MASVVGREGPWRASRETDLFFSPPCLLLACPICRFCGGPGCSMCVLSFDRMMLLPGSNSRSHSSQLIQPHSLGLYCLAVFRASRSLNRHSVSDPMLKKRSQTKPTNGLDVRLRVKLSANMQARGGFVSSVNPRVRQHEENIKLEAWFL